MKKHILVLLLILLSTQVDSFAKTRKVLFIGNSYTAGLPGVIDLLCQSLGDTLIFQEVSPGGFTLQGHSTDPGTLSAIKQDKWDIVVIQEQSQRPAFSPGQVASDTYPYAKTLVDSIKANHNCSEPMFYMTWGRKNGDASNCPFYPPICTYAGMQQRLRESYLEMAKDNNGSVSPVGAAWKVVRDSVSTIDLYQPDESHPSNAGRYLAACVFYSSIFHKSPHGSNYTSGLSNSDAERLQYFAGKVVLDSMDNWFKDGNYPVARFSASLPTANNSQVDLTNSSLNATSYYWDFGDGNNSIQTNPTHYYTATGKYIITLSATNNCFTNTQSSDSLARGHVNVSEIDAGNSNVIQIANTGNGSITTQVLLDDYKELNIYNTSGQKIRTIKKQRVAQISNLPPGMYIYHLIGQQKEFTDKFIVY